MEVFRLSKKRWSEVLTGKGAALKGARWNSPGPEMIYCSTSRSLAMAEVAVHNTLATIPGDYMMQTLSIPDDTFLKMFREDELPVLWNSFPHRVETQKIGDEFVRRNIYCLLKIPSVVVRGDFNLLINPFHPQFKEIKIVRYEPFPFDHRIFK